MVTYNKDITNSNQYPSVEFTMSNLLAAAELAGVECTSRHPEDIEVTMTAAMMNAAKLLTWQYRNGYFDATSSA